MTQDEIDYSKLAAQIDPEQIAAEMDTGEVADDRFMLSRRQLAAIAGSGLGAGVLGALGIGSAEASTPGSGDGESGVLGSSSDRVDAFLQDIDVSQEATVQDLTVNGSVTGIAGGIALKPGDSITNHVLDRVNTGGTFVNLFSSTSGTTVLGGILNGNNKNDYLYEFSDGSTVQKNGSGGTYNGTNQSAALDENADFHETTFLPPAEDVVRVDVATSFVSSNAAMGAEVFTI
jgi:hypothetical protein